jgi:hypothetical protein
MPGRSPAKKNQKEDQDCFSSLFSDFQLYRKIAAWQAGIDG